MSVIIKTYEGLDFLTNCVMAANAAYSSKNPYNRNNCKNYENSIVFWNSERETLENIREKLPPPDNNYPFEEKINKLVGEKNLDGLIQRIDKFARTVNLEEYRPNGKWRHTIKTRIYDLTLLNDICNYMIVDTPEHEYYLYPFYIIGNINKKEYESYCNFFDSYFLEVQKRLDSQKTSAINKHMVGTYLNRG